MRFCAPIRPPLVVAAVAVMAAITIAAGLIHPSQAAATSQTRAASRTLKVGVSMGDQLRRVDAATRAAALDDVRRLGARWIRIDIPWTDLQPVANRPVQWQTLDPVIRAAQARGLRVLGIVTYTPGWARDRGCASFTCPPANPRSFAQFAAEVVKRYPRSQLRAIEVWNEPNIQWFWPSPNAQRYGRLLKATIAAVSRVDPRRTVLFGGMAPAGSHRNDIDAARFLVRACAARRCSGMDAVGYHPYTTPFTARDRTTFGTAWERVTTNAPGRRKALRAAARKAGVRAPFWFTEFGAPSAPRGQRGVASGKQAVKLKLRGPVAVSETHQARIVASGVRAARRTPAVKALFLYTWRDLQTYGNTEDHYGLRRVDGTPKPAWFALRKAIRG